jgi:hypothetical protein
MLSIASATCQAARTASRAQHQKLPSRLIGEQESGRSAKGAWRVRGDQITSAVPDRHIEAARVRRRPACRRPRLQRHEASFRSRTAQHSRVRGVVEKEAFVLDRADGWTR